MRALWKFRVIIVIAALVLVAGGAIVAGAEGLVGGGESPKTTAGSSEQHQQTTGNEPAQQPKAPEPTATKGTEPTPIPTAVWKGKIVSVDCANGSITIAPDGAAPNTTTSAAFAQGASFNVAGQAAACSNLKVGWHVTIEVKQVNGQWVAVRVTQDDSGQPTSCTGDGCGSGSPTPAPSH